MTIIPSSNCTVNKSSSIHFILVKQEAWSEGLETDVAEFLSSVYGMLVFGETVAPDGSILSAPSTSSSNSNPSQGASKGQQSSGGFGSMSQWQGGGVGNNNNSSNNSNSKSGSSSNGGGKGDRQAGTTVMLSDLPRRVIIAIRL